MDVCERAIVAGLLSFLLWCVTSTTRGLRSEIAHGSPYSQLVILANWKHLKLCLVMKTKGFFFLQKVGHHTKTKHLKPPSRNIKMLPFIEGGGRRGTTNFNPFVCMWWKYGRVHVRAGCDVCAQHWMQHPLVVRVWICGVPEESVTLWKYHDFKLPTEGCQRWEGGSTNASVG